MVSTSGFDPKGSRSFSGKGSIYHLLNRFETDLLRNVHDKHECYCNLLGGLAS